MSGQHLHEFPKDENVSLHHQATQANDYERPEDRPYRPAPTFDNFHGSLNPFTLPSSACEHFDNAGTLVNYQHAFQPLNFDSQYHMRAYSGAQSSNMDTPSTFLISPTPTQPWIDEIHSSYTPVVGENFDWTPPDAHLYGWLVETPFTTSAEQVAYANTPTVLPVGQYVPLESTALEEALVQHFVSDRTPRLPRQEVFPKPASIALKVRNEKFKDIATVLYENPGHNGQQSIRVTKTKKAEKAEKGDNHVKQEACWRCKRYRKACIGKDVCKECSTAGFRVWPSAIGCRRGAMESFVEKIMPSHSVGILRGLRVGVSRTSNWRKALYQPDEVPLSPDGTNPADRWNLLKHKIQSTLVFGPELSALVDILAAYENSRKTEIPIWTQSIILLSSTCDFYHFFVASSNTEIHLPQLVNATVKFRKSLARSWDMFLKLCLSGRRENWFPAFLSVVLGICSMVILLDAVPSMPVSTRKAIWADVDAIVRDLRVRQHMMSLDLLRIGAKGINPLRLDCWMAEEELDSEGRKAQKRNPKGMALLGHDSAAFDGFISLRQWHSRNKATMLEGIDMWDSVPFTKSNILAIAALSRVFEF